MDPMDIAYIGYMAETEGRSTSHISKVANELKGNCSSVISRSEFESACRRAGVSPSSFSQSDLNKMVDIMNK